MPKPLKKPVRKLKTPPKPKRPSDPNRAAHSMIAEHMGRVQQEPPLDFEAQYKAHMAKLGAKGGKASGAKRMENLSDDERREIASQAARKRWADVAKRKAAKKR